jgi:hypothetical protein
MRLLNMNGGNKGSTSCNKGEVAESTVQTDGMFVWLVAGGWY